jgi:hypothetical protein
VVCGSPSTYRAPNSFWYFAAASFHLILNVGVKVPFLIENSSFKTWICLTYSYPFKPFFTPSLVRISRMALTNLFSFAASSNAAALVLVISFPGIGEVIFARLTRLGITTARRYN